MLGDIENGLRRRLLVTVICLAVGLLLVPPVRSQGTMNRAGLLIQHGDGTTITTCVTFEEPSITGLELLRRAGVSMSFDSSSGLGTAVCALDGEGCNYPGENCFCQCQGASCTYWVYWHLVEGEWQYANTGAVNWKVTDGGVDGWVWGVGDPGSGEMPPATSFAEICGAEPSATSPATSDHGAEQGPAIVATPVPPPSLRAQPPGTPVPASGLAGGLCSASYLAFLAMALANWRLKPRLPS